MNIKSILLEEFKKDELRDLFKRIRSGKIKEKEMKSLGLDISNYRRNNNKKFAETSSVYLNREVSEDMIVANLNVIKMSDIKELVKVWMNKNQEEDKVKKNEDKKSN